MSTSHLGSSNRSNDDSNKEPLAKRPKPSASPTTFVTWNCNGLVSRCKWNPDQLEKLLRETHHPDVLCLQEVRLKATSSANRGIPLPSDYKAVKECMEDTIFADYDKFWSLADTKYAGTLTLLHKRLHFDPSQAAFSTQTALSLLLKKYHLTRQDIGISSSSSSSSTSSSSAASAAAAAAAPSPSSKNATTQTSLKSFFAPKKSPNAKSLLSFARTHNSRHHDEGRFQFFVFDNFDLINTYVPNNGTNDESFQRRRDWDADLLQFLQNRQTLLAKVDSNNNNNHNFIKGSQQQQRQQQQQQLRPLLWCGDCNVAMDYRDGTHWEQREEEDGSIIMHEFWKDESQCFVASARNKLNPNRHVNDQGIPSFTNNERNRFLEILNQADLSDVWRELHPNGVVDDAIAGGGESRYKSLWDRPNWTWRGHLSKEGNSYASKYQGKGQRLDYFLLSPSRLTKQVVESCEILGYGERREGLFCGSDHCATILRLNEAL